MRASGNSEHGAKEKPARKMIGILLEVSFDPSGLASLQVASSLTF